ncbi:MAG: hypothetical protein LBI96_00945 [Odoribacteraceae bacterium]|nr:hypothetical protein [Odoribacteraceae bacterium]
MKRKEKNTKPAPPTSRGTRRSASSRTTAGILYIDTSGKEYYDYATYP